ncbi:hypothetical protein SASPL_102374 [Salvia splendens]|uniref:Uncharacterized protein n=1 Tax=Salvia splendens TaxID=180675 RepID=A0A8X9ACS9_SALSN|nr:hypothetical protein SASPL_102374 [Salvia splendens]
MKHTEGTSLAWKHVDGENIGRSFSGHTGKCWVLVVVLVERRVTGQRHSWSPREDEVLILELKDLVSPYAKMGVVPSSTQESLSDVYNVNLDDLYTQEEIQESLNPDIRAESSYRSLTALNNQSEKVRGYISVDLGGDYKDER